MYQHLWPNRFELDKVDLPDEPEQNAWRLLTGVKKYSELVEGDRVWWYGYKGTVRDIRVAYVCEAGPYKGERVYRFVVDLEPSSDHIEKTIYNGGVYGGVESLTVALRD